VGLTGSGGNYLNRYSYLPFGESLTVTEAIPNSFAYVGQWGVMDEGNGLDFMRARYYATEDGRFLSVDPLGIAGGDLNLYGYAFNNPVKFNDPNGQQEVPVSSGGVVISGAVVYVKAAPAYHSYTDQTNADINGALAVLKKPTSQETINDAQNTYNEALKEGQTGSAAGNALNRAAGLGESPPGEGLGHFLGHHLGGAPI